MLDELNWQEVPAPGVQGDAADLDAAMRKRGLWRSGSEPPTTDPRYVLGKPHEDRAKIFAPFASLKGYYDMVDEAERVPEPFHQLTDEEAEALSEMLAGLHKGDPVAVTHYVRDAYTQTQGVVSQVVPAEGRLVLYTLAIDLDTIRSIQRL